MSNSDPGPQLSFSTDAPKERNWLPMALAAAVVLIIVVIFFFVGRKPATTVMPVNAPPDPYAASLPITNLQMSESANLAGTKVTYIDGHITNTGSRTIASVQVQVIFRSYTHEVAQNEALSLQRIRTREPYVDVQPLSAAPLQPGGQADFRLIFDRVSEEWDGAYPELRIVRVEAK